MSIESWKTVLSDERRKKEYQSYIEEREKEIGAFLEISLEQQSQNSDGSLAGVPFGVKDNIAAEGFKLTCGSKMLQQFNCPYDATVVAKLKAAGAVPVGKTNLDEFGMGSSTENSALGETRNPWDTAHVAGGSSGGSAAAVASGMVPFALGTDTGGSVRQPAAFCGVYGLKPTYGALSRFGLVAYASSLEVPGILGTSPAVIRSVFELARGRDERDQSSVGYPGLSTEDGGNPAITAPSDDAKVIGVLGGLDGLSPAVEENYSQSREQLSRAGYTVKTIDLPTLEYAVAAYYTIATAEASANLARYTGIRYGYRNTDAATMEEMVRKTRTEGFGHEVKLRILLGTYVLRSGFQDQYYGKAQKVRTAIRNDFSRVFSDIDLLLLPVFPTQAFKKGESGLDPFQQKLADKFTVPVNLAGLPALSFPTGTAEGLPLGMQFIGPAFSEERIFKAAEAYAAAAGTDPIQTPPGYRSI